MTANTYELILNTVQAIVLVVTLILVYWQLRKIDDSIRYDAASRAVDYFHKFNEVEIQNPSVMRAYHKASLDAGTDIDQLAAQHWAYLVLGTFERLYQLKESRGQKGLDPESWASWERWLTGDFMKSDIFRSIWDQNRPYFAESFVQYIDSKYEASTTPTS